MDVKELQEKLNSKKKIIITTHRKPDGDALGASLALYHYLIQKGHQTTVIIPDSSPEFLHWLPDFNTVIDFEKEQELSKKLVREADIIFCLDFNMSNRLKGLEPFVKQADAVKVLIDHHLGPEDFCNYIYSFPGISATSELIYRFICALGDKQYINKSIAECIYTGIMTDTGSFRFNTMLPETHRIVAELMEAGAENHKIHERIYDNFSVERTKFLGYSIYNKMRVLKEYNTAVMCITKDEMYRFNYQTGDTEGFVNVGMEIKDIRLSALFIERKDEVKVSLRSKGDFSVSELAVKYFNGGGHKNAAGGSTVLPVEKAIEKFIALLANYKEKLTA